MTDNDTNDPFKTPAAGITPHQIATEIKASKNKLVEKTAEKKRKRLERKEKKLDKVRDALENVTKQLGQVTEGLKNNQKQIEKIYDDEEKIDEEEAAQKEKILDELYLGLQGCPLYTSTTSGSAITSPASSRASSRSASPMPRASLAVTFDGAAGQGKEGDKKDHVKTPKQSAKKTPKKPSPVLENQESKMPILVANSPAIFIYDRKTDSFDVVDTKAILSRLGHTDAATITPVILGMAQIGKLTFAILGKDGLAAGGQIVTIGPPTGLVSYVGHALVGRYPDFQSEVGRVTDCGNDVVFMSAFSNGEKGVLATLSASGQVFIHSVHGTKVTFVESFEKEEFFPEEIDVNSDLVLEAVDVGYDFVSALDNEGNIHVLYPFTGQFHHFANDGTIVMNASAGLANGETQILAWGDKVGRNNRTRPTFFLSKSTENPWNSVLSEIKGVSAMFGTANQGGFLALGSNKVSYVSSTGEPNSWKRVDWGKNEAVKSTLIAATDDCFLAVPDGKPGKLLLVSSKDTMDTKDKSIKASLLDMDARLEQSGKAIKEVLALAGSSLRIALSFYDRDMGSISAGNSGAAMGKIAPATDGAQD